MRTRPFGFLLVGITLLLACSSEPPTPPTSQYFADFKNNLASLDYDTALKNLDRMVKAAGDQPIGQQGIVLRAVLLTAMAEGNKRMADAYALGVKQPAAQARPGAFSKMRAGYYGMSRVRLMNAMEAVMAQRSRMPEQPVALDLAFPEFSGIDPAALAQIEAGRTVSDNERYRAELESVRNAFALRLATLAGAGSDVQKAHAQYQKGGLPIESRLYLVEMSEAFLRLSDIFGPRAVDDPRYRRVTLEVVRDNLDIALKLLAAKPDKDLEARAKKLKADCEKQLKTLAT